MADENKIPGWRSHKSHWKCGLLEFESLFVITSHIYIYLESLGRNVGKITPTWRSPAPLQVFPMAQESLLIYHWFDLCKCFSWSTAHEIRLKTNKDMASQIHREKEKNSSEIIIARNLCWHFSRKRFTWRIRKRHFGSRVLQYAHRCLFPTQSSKGCPGWRTAWMIGLLSRTETSKISSRIQGILNSRLIPNVDIIFYVRWVILILHLCRLIQCELYVWSMSILLPSNAKWSICYNVDTSFIYCAPLVCEISCQLHVFMSMFCQIKVTWCQICTIQFQISYQNPSIYIICDSRFQTS